MADQPTDRVTPDTVVQISANLEAYVAERAQAKAEAALARARLEAHEQVKAVRENLGTALRYETGISAELRRQLEAAHRTIKRGERAADQQVERLQRETRDIRTELAKAIGAPHDTDWNTLVRRVRIDYAALLKQRNEACAERDEAQAEADAERASNDALRKNNGQLADELRAARAELAAIRKDCPPIGGAVYGIVREAIAGRLNENEAVRALEDTLILPLANRERNARLDAEHARGRANHRQSYQAQLRRDRDEARAQRSAAVRLVAAAYRDAGVDLASDGWPDWGLSLDSLEVLAALNALEDAPPAQDEPEVTVPPGTPPAAMRCPHRDFDDPTRCWTCFP